MYIGETEPIRETRWGFEEIKPDDGPSMTASGTGVKLLLLLAVFTAGFLFSWQHIHAQHLHDSPMERIRTTMLELPAWQGSFFYAAARFPLYAWFLFFLFFAASFLTKKGLAIVVPICVAIEGVSCGSFEYVLHDRYPGITLLCGTLAVGMLLGLFLVYWFGFADSDDFILPFLTGAIGGVAFTYFATSVIRSFAIDVPFLHQGPVAWKWSTLAFIGLGSGLLVSTFRRIHKAIDAGAPKWVEWRAALCLFVSFLFLLKMLRRLLLQRTTRQLVWDSITSIVKSMR